MENACPMSARPGTRPPHSILKTYPVLGKALFAFQLALLGLFCVGVIVRRRDGLVLLLASIPVYMTACTRRH
jgi:hypothetical protein